MNKERELLRQALEAWDNEDDVTLIHEVLEEIRTYLSTPSDEAKKPVGYQWLHSGHFSKQIPKNANAIEWYPLYLHPPKPAESEAGYDFYGVIPLTHRKAKGIIKDRGYHVTGFVLSRPDGDKCIVDMSAVRWLTGKEFFEMMHPPVVSPTAEPARKPMTDEEMEKRYEIDKEYFGESVMRAFYNGVRFAEKHHDITDADV